MRHASTIERCVLTALAAMVVLLIPVTWSADAEANRRQEAIDEVRNALSERSYPWYDKDKDAAHLLELERTGEYQTLKFWIYQIVTMVVMGTIAAGLMFLLSKLLQHIRRHDKPPAKVEKPKQKAKGTEEELPQPEGSGDLLAAAQLAAKNGDYRTALIFLFNHQLGVLGKRGLVRLHPSRTNRQYTRQLRDRTQRELFGKMVLLFELVVFGARDADRDAYERADEIAHELNKKLSLTRIIHRAPLADDASAT